MELRDCPILQKLTEAADILRHAPVMDYPQMVLLDLMRIELDRARLLALQVFPDLIGLSEDSA